MRRLQSSGVVPSFVPSGQTNILQQVEDVLRGLRAELSQIMSEYNAEVYPVLSTLPQGTNDSRWSLTSSICPRKNGFDGTQVFVDNSASLELDSGRYWNSSYSRPRTIKESFVSFYSTLSSELDAVRAELAALVPGGSTGTNYKTYQGASGAEASSASETVIGALCFDASEVSITCTISFETIAGLFWGGVSTVADGKIYLYDVGAPGAVTVGRLVTTLSTLSIGQGNNVTDRLSATLVTSLSPSTNQIYSSERIYEIRAKLVNSDEGDLCKILWAGIVVKPS